MTGSLDYTGGVSGADPIPSPLMEMHPFPLDDRELSAIVGPSVEKLFANMLALDISLERASREILPIGRHEIIGIIGISGDCAGSLMFVCDVRSARRLATDFVGRDFAYADENVLDAVGEMANMIVGGLKSVLETPENKMSITPPTVFRGHSPVARSRQKLAWLILRYSAFRASFQVRLLLGKK